MTKTDTVKFTNPTDDDDCTLCDKPAVIVVTLTPSPSYGFSSCPTCGGERAFCAEHWLEFQRAVANARPYGDHTKKEEPVILTGNRPENGASQTAKGLVQSMPWSTIEGLHLSVPAGEYEPREARTLMLDEWPECDPDVLKDIRDKLNPLLVKRFEGMNTREVYDALQQDAYEQAIMKLSDEEIAVLKTVWKAED